MTIIQGDALSKLKDLETDSIDLIVTDPPYGYSFMNKDWDKAVVGVDTWKECLRVLKPGSFAFIMSSPRQDVFCKMMLNLIEAGFETNFSSLYWAYASGFPKAADVSKLVDKRNNKPQRVIDLEKYLADKIKSKYKSHHILAEEMGVAESLIRHWIGKCGDQYLIPTQKQYDILKQKLDLDARYDKLIEWEEAEREIIAKSKDGAKSIYGNELQTKELDITKPATEQAKKLEGAYAGFQPKPAVELILVVMKPLSEKSYVDQALSNGKGVTWFDDCRIPYQSEQDMQTYKDKIGGKPWSTPNSNEGWKRDAHESYTRNPEPPDKGRFPANLLVESDVLNDGRITKGTGGKWAYTFGYRHYCENAGYDHITEKAANQSRPIKRPNDEGSFSRYFDLDAWWAKTLPFLITPKASKSEKDKGLSDIPITSIMGGGGTNNYEAGHKFGSIKAPKHNSHPTVKPLKLMSYLITMGSREGDTILDPFCGSGTTLVAAHQLHRKYIGIEISEEYCEITRKRLEPYQKQAKLL